MLGILSDGVSPSEEILLEDLAYLSRGKVAFVGHIRLGLDLLQFRLVGMMALNELNQTKSLIQRVVIELGKFGCH